jgi:hypothetical protein
MKTFQEFILESHCNSSPKGMDCPSHGSAKCPKVKSHKTVEAIAKKHRMEVSDIQKQLDVGIPIEHEHTKDKVLATYISLQHLDEIPDYYTRLKKMEASAKKEHKKFKDVRIDEEGLGDWFGKSESKDKKPGWVDVVDGDACAREEGETATPKCVSSEKRASMSKEERLAAQAAKRREDPNQPQKSGASKPTMVKTDRKTRKEEMNLQEVKDKPGKGSGKKDACYSKVKSRYRVWPSAYASGALVKCRKVGADSWGTKSESTGALDYDWNTPIYGGEERYCPKCKKMEHMHICKYGPEFWRSYSFAVEPHDHTKEIIHNIFSSHMKEKYNYKKMKNLKNIQEIYTRIQSRGSTYSILLNWRGKYISAQMFFPQFARPPKDQVTFEVRKIYPGAIVLSYNPASKDPTKPLLFTGTENGSK